MYFLLSANKYLSTSFYELQVVFLDIDGVVRPLSEGKLQLNTIQIDGINVPLAGAGNDFTSGAMQALKYIVE